MKERKNCGTAIRLEAHDNGMPSVGPSIGDGLRTLFGPETPIGFQISGCDDGEMEIGGWEGDLV